MPTNSTMPFITAPLANLRSTAFNVSFFGTRCTLPSRLLPIRYGTTRMQTNSSPGPYKVGFCLAGAATGGAYSAGVMDFLLEALAAWDKEKNRPDPDSSIPQWDIALTELIGTSAGGINSVLTVNALNTGHEPLPRDYELSPACPPANNSLFRAWVHEVTYENVFKTDDLDSQLPFQTTVSSLFYSDFMKETVNKLLSPTVIHKTVPKWAKDLYLTLTATNLRGVPYSVRNFTDKNDGKKKKYYMRKYADYTQFRVSLNRFEDDKKKRDGNRVIYLNTERLTDQTWRAVIDCARATAAYPVGFPTVAVHTPRSEYVDRMPRLPDWRKKKAEEKKYMNTLQSGYERLLRSFPDSTKEKMEELELTEEADLDEFFVKARDQERKTYTYTSDLNAIFGNAEENYQGTAYGWTVDWDEDLDKTVGGQQPKNNIGTAVSDVYTDEKGRARERKMILGAAGSDKSLGETRRGQKQKRNVYSLADGDVGKTETNLEGKSVAASEDGSEDFSTQVEEKEPEMYIYAAIDGGVCNNAPFGILSKNMEHRNEGKSLDVKPCKSWGSVILVDPFPSKRKELDPKLMKEGLPLVDTIWAMFNATRGEASFKEEEISAALSTDSMGRFIITPKAIGDSKKAELATHSLGTFGGILDPRIPYHDFVLGRANCKYFLEHVFVIKRKEAKHNSIFKDYVNNTVGNDEDPIPIIPVVGSAERKIDHPEWPIFSTQKKDEIIEKVMGASRKRLEKVLQAYMENLGIIKDYKKLPWGQKLSQILTRIEAYNIKGRLMDKLMLDMKEQLETAMSDYTKQD